MIHYKTLESTPIETVLKTFNQSFSDYAVPLNLSLEQLQDRIYGDDIQMDFSVGAFHNEELIGLMLHSKRNLNGENWAYNAGTGVVPEFRGQRITQKMYDFLKPYLATQGVRHIALEVIQGNLSALKSYQNAGFEIVRSLNCYKGEIKKDDKSNEIRALEQLDWEKMKSFWNAQPTWQNSEATIEKLKASNWNIGIFKDEELVGYLIFNPKVNRIQQLAVAPQFRNQGYGSALMQFLVEQGCSSVAVINVDEQDSSLNAFYQALGLEKYMQLYEMHCDLRNVF